MLLFLGINEADGKLASYTDVLLARHAIRVTRIAWRRKIKIGQKSCKAVRKHLTCLLGVTSCKTQRWASCLGLVKHQDFPKFTRRKKFVDFDITSKTEGSDIKPWLAFSLTIQFNSTVTGKPIKIDIRAFFPAHFSHPGTYLVICDSDQLSNGHWLIDFASLCSFTLGRRYLREKTHVFLNKCTMLQ